MWSSDRSCREQMTRCRSVSMSYVMMQMSVQPVLAYGFRMSMSPMMLSCLKNSNLSQNRTQKLYLSNDPLRIDQVLKGIHYLNSPILYLFDCDFFIVLAIESRGHHAVRARPYLLNYFIFLINDERGPSHFIECSSLWDHYFRFLGCFFFGWLHLRPCMKIKILLFHKLTTTHQYSENVQQRQQVGKDKGMPKIHEIWPGNNRFFCGCCITGPISDLAANLCWYVCAVGVTIPFSIFVTAKLWNNVTPILPILFYLSVVFTTIFLLLVSCTDPGIIPRKPFLVALSLSDQKYASYLTPAQADGELSKRLCSTCQIYRPPRASHCSVCDNCVQVFDHHCPFVNNCIGKRNYRFFIMFLIGVVCTVTTTIVNLVVFALNQGGSQINPTIIIIIVSVVFGVIAVPLLGFLIFHIYLALSGNTTRQLLKKIDHADKQQNQWCNVDPSLIQYDIELSEEQSTRINFQLEQMKNIKPTVII